MKPRTIIRLLFAPAVGNTFVAVTDARGNYGFNHANLGSYVTAESNASYGRPVQNSNVAYQPRMMPLGFRIAS